MPLAAFFGLYYGVLGVGQLVGSSIISGRFLTRYGLGFGLLALPVANLATSGAAAITGVLPMAAGVFGSEDAKEGPRAFAEKRAPNWSGRY